MRVGNRRALKRTGAAMLASLTSAFGLALIPGAAGALPGFDFDRLAGLDRFETAGVVAAEAYPTGADTVIVALATNFPDALSGNYLAGAEDAPILLADTGNVPDATLAAIGDLGAEDAIVLGDTGALDDAVVDDLEAAGLAVTRIAGENRFDTAREIAEQPGDANVGLNEDGDRTAILSTGLKFPDALAAGPLATADSFPVLLSGDVALSPEAEFALLNLEIDHVILTGGTQALSLDVETALLDLGYSVERIDGVDRYETARDIAEKAINDLGHRTDTVDVASGEDFPDALTGGAFSGVENSTLILTNADSANVEACEFLTEHADTLISKGFIFGGTDAVSAEAETELEVCAGNPGGGGATNGNNDFVVDVTEPTLGNLPLQDGIVFQTYSFSDVSADEVDITFVPCFAVTQDSLDNFSIADDPVPAPIDGAQPTFPPAQDDDQVTQGDYLGNGHRSYLGGPASTVVFRVDGQLANNVIGTPYVDDYSVQGGVVEVEYAARQSDCAYPLIFDDSASDDALNLDGGEDAENEPTDPFAIGGALIASEGEAADGEVIDGQVMFLNTEEDYIVLDDPNGFNVSGNVFHYNDGDEFPYDANVEFGPFPGDGGQGDFPDEFNVSLEQFETWVSPLDFFSEGGSDNPNYSRSAQNTFELDDDYAGTPEFVQAEVGDFDDDDLFADSNLNDLKVTWNTPDPVNGLITDYYVELWQGGNIVTTVFDSDDEPLGSVPENNQDIDGDSIDDDVDNEVIIENLAKGDYQVVVNAYTATNDNTPFPFSSTGASLFGSDSSNLGTLSVVESGPGAPRSINATINHDPLIPGTQDIVTAGDVLRFTFNEIIVNNAMLNGASITLTDADGTVATLTDGLSASFTRVGGGFVLRIDVLFGGPVIDVAGADGELGPAGITVTDSTGVRDFGDGQEWDLPNSPDKTI